MTRTRCTTPRTSLRDDARHDDGSREPSGSVTSTNGVDMSIRRPEPRSIRSTRVRTSVRHQLRGPGMHTQTVRVTLPKGSPTTRSYNIHPRRSRPWPTPDGCRPKGPLPRTDPRARSSIKGAQGPRAKRLSGCCQTSERRRRRTTEAFSSAGAATQDRDGSHLLHSGRREFVVTGSRQTRLDAVRRG